MKAYDLSSVTLPVMTGRVLATAAKILENPAARALLLPKLLNDAGITKLRSLCPEEVPTGSPLVAPVGKKAKKGADLSVEDLKQNSGQCPGATVADLALAFREGRISPETVAEKALSAISDSKTGNRAMHWFVTVNSDDVLAQARESARRIGSGKPLSVLDGIPVAVKDEVDVKGYPTTVGTSFLGKSPAPRDSFIVGRLRAAGAVILGKANMHEIGINPSGQNVHYGAARNPFDPERDTGGSSSGPAGAVAGGLCPIAVAADGGGSIRIPAALCGQVGLKPTYGRVSENGAAPLCWSVAHLGPIGATVADVAAMYQVVAGHDPEDANTAAGPPVSLAGWDAPDLSGLRLGIMSPWFDHAQPAVVSACRKMLAGLADAGAKIVEVEIPGLDEMRIAHAVTILSEMAASMENHPRDFSRFGPTVRVNLIVGKAFSSADYVKAQRLRTRALRSFSAAFEKADVLMTPATAITAPAIPPDGDRYGWSDLSTVTELMRYAFPGNFTGVPAISFPAGYDDRGLPIGIQAMAPWWEEALLLRVARIGEKLVERRRPKVFTDLLV
ncbi:MAG: amidase [Thermodesulfobacteriota bacterium]